MGCKQTWVQLEEGRELLTWLCLSSQRAVPLSAQLTPVALSCPGCTTILTTHSVYPPHSKQQQINNS